MRRHVRRSLCAAFTALVLGCAAPVPSPPVLGATQESRHQNVRGAARSAAIELARQIQLLDKGRGSIWVSPAINKQSGEITASGRELQVLLALDLKSILTTSSVQSLGGQTETEWGWVISPQVEFEKPQDGSVNINWFKIKATAVSSKGELLPGVVLRVNAQQFDATPSRFFRDAPIYLTGQYHENRSKLALQADKSEGAIAERRRFVAIEALNQQGILDYEEGRQKAALVSFERALELDPKNLPALYGVYQIWQDLNDQPKFEQSFKKLVAAAVEQENISFRFLFRVRTAEFRDDIDIAKQYDFWLYHLSKEISASGRCLLIQGHASKSGSAEYNDRLSHERAKQVAAQMIRQAPGLRNRVEAEGKGFRSNLVGSGTDDAKDAIDRRVDFKLRTCESSGRRR